MLTITLKTLEQKTFKIEIEESQTVKVLKEKISEECGTDVFPVHGQRLIYAGRILDDDLTLSECKIDTENGYVVVMFIKPKANVAEMAAAAAAMSITTVATTYLTTSASSSWTTTATTVASETRSASTPSSWTTTGISSEVPSETPSTEIITELMSLGYSRDEVMLALDVSFNNAERAADYLLSGTIPDKSEDMESGGVGGGEAEMLLTADDVAYGDLSGEDIHTLVTTSEKEAIDRICALGFLGYPTVIQAFFACDKNEQLAVDFLFSNSNDL